MDDQPLVKKYTFRTTKSPDGSLRYFVNDTELQDKNAYDNIKAKTDQTINKVWSDKEAEDNASFNQMDSDFDKATKGYAKGGKVKKSASPKKKSHPNW